MALLLAITCALICAGYGAAKKTEGPPNPPDLPDVQKDIEWGIRAFGALIASALVSLGSMYDFEEVALNPSRSHSLYSCRAARYQWP